MKIPNASKTYPHRSFSRRAACFVGGLASLLLVALTVQAQIDPEDRNLLHVGVNESLTKTGPMGAYAFYYWNQANLWKTNLFLRLAIAPCWVDGELGIKSLLGENTDVGVGFSGGALANSYQEVRGGQYYQSESFNGNGYGGNLSVYHLFNPGGMIPLTGILRGGVDYKIYDDTDRTAHNFVTPNNQPFVSLRTGFRWGGKEPVLSPRLAMEVSAWYELDHRCSSGGYGFANDRELESNSQQIFGRALIHYMTQDEKHYVVLSLQGGTVIDPDRFSAYRLGGMLPYTKEFPLQIPGYFYQELSARDFGLIYSVYSYRIAESSWYLRASAAAAVVKYAPGEGQSGAFNSGIGTGIGYYSQDRRWRVITLLGLGLQAQRGGGEGGYSFGVAFQYNFGQAKMASDRAFDKLGEADRTQGSVH